MYMYFFICLPKSSEYSIVSFPCTLSTGSYGIPGLFGGVVNEMGGALSGSLATCNPGQDMTQCIIEHFTEDDFTTCGRRNSMGIVCATGEWAGHTGCHGNDGNVYIRKEMSMRN